MIIKSLIIERIANHRYTRIVCRASLCAHTHHFACHMYVCKFSWFVVSLWNICFEFICERYFSAFSIIRKCRGVKVLVTRQSKYTLCRFDKTHTSDYSEKTLSKLYLYLIAITSKWWQRQIAMSQRVLYIERSHKKIWSIYDIVHLLE